jgi:phage anti-repressor protein
MNKHAPGAPVALVPVFAGEIAGSPVQLCNARHLHRYLMVARDFSDWIKYRIEQYGFVEGEDFIEFSPNLRKNSRGRPAKDYHITLDMAKELAMVENNDQGRHIRRYFIACERQAHATPAQLPAPSDSLPPAVQEAIRRKVLELSVQSADTLRHRLEKLARARLTEGATADVLAWLAQIDGPNAEVVLVSAGELYAVTSMAMAAHVAAEFAKEAVENLERSTGRAWAGARGGAK